MSIHQRVRTVRSSLGLNQKDFGIALNLQQGAVSHIERGGTLTDKNIMSICHQFGINENWLRTGEGEMLAAEEAAKLPHAALLKIVYQLNPAMQEQLLHTAQGLLELQRKLNMAELAVQLADVVPPVQDPYVEETLRNLHEQFSL